MSQILVLTGDVNLKGVTDPAAPFAKVAAFTRKADILFGNLECCFCDEPDQQLSGREGFYAPTVAAEALCAAGFHVVGTANNVTYGDGAILESLAQLDRLGIAHTGAGRTQSAACQPAIVKKHGVTYGFVQRTSVYWPRNHEASNTSPGVAILRGHTAYRPRIDEHAADRPGLPPEILTWADPEQLKAYRRELQSLSSNVDFLIASHHWGLGGDVLAYQRDIAHAAIEAGADIVVGHGPHVPLAIEIYREKPIFYGIGCFSFQIGHHGPCDDWLGYLVRARLDGALASEVAIQFVRRSAMNETILRVPSEEPVAVGDLINQSAALGTRLIIEADRLIVEPSVD